MLRIESLNVSVKNRHIVRGVSLSIRPSEVHILMGPNGSGKSSLAFALMGHPDYKIKSGKIKINRRDITKKLPNQRAKNGLFLVFQQPLSISGVSVANLLRTAIQPKETKKRKLSSIAKFNQELEKIAEELQIKKELLRRSINEGFSGGEKKKIEMLQLLMLQPKYAIVDEIDTGLDIDALKIVAKAINKLSKQLKAGVLLITHYQRILRFIKATRIHIMLDGRIVESGDYKLAEKLEKKGYKIFSQ